MNASDFVLMRNGLMLPVAAVRLALDLEQRGCRLNVEGDDLVIGPKDRITDADRQNIRRYRDHLKAIIACAETVQ